MNTRILIAVALCCLAQTTFGYVVKRETEVATPSPADALIKGLTTFFEEADAKVKELSKSFLEVVGVKDEQELRNNIQEKVKTYTQSLQGRFNDIQEEAGKHTGEYEKILKGFANTLQQEIQKLQTADSPLADATKKYQSSFEEIVKTVQGTVQTLRNNSSGITGAFEDTAKKILKETEATAVDVKKAIDEKTAA